MTLRLVPVTLAVANEHVAAWHRHNAPVVGHKFSIGVSDAEGVLRAVAIVGRPVARGFDDGDTLEVVRVASDGAKNACSMLYGACKRAAFALGYRRVVTYTQADESGASPRAAGYRVIAQRPARPGWSMPSRPRDDEGYRSVARQLWEATADDSEATGPLAGTGAGRTARKADTGAGFHPATRPNSISVALADLEYVLAWLRQSEAPDNIIGLQERAADLIVGRRTE